MKVSAVLYDLCVNRFNLKSMDVQHNIEDVNIKGFNLVHSKLLSYFFVTYCIIFEFY